MSKEIKREDIKKGKEEKEEKVKVEQDKKNTKGRGCCCS